MPHTNPMRLRRELLKVSLVCNLSANSKHPLLVRLINADMKSVAELKELAAIDPDQAFGIAWEFVNCVADVWADTHICSGFVDGALIAMQKARGTEYTEQKLLNSWQDISEACRSEICYAGVSNPVALSSRFCERLFLTSGVSIADRRVIIGSLASTMKARGLTPKDLAPMLQELVTYEAAHPSNELANFIGKIRGYN